MGAHSDETVPLVGGLASETKIFIEDYGLYAGHSLAARSPRFTDSVTLSAYSHVKNVTMLLLQCELWIVADISA